MYFLKLIHFTKTFHRTIDDTKFLHVSPIHTITIVDSEDFLFRSCLLFLSAVRALNADGDPINWIRRNGPGEDKFHITPPGSGEHRPGARTFESATSSSSSYHLGPASFHSAGFPHVHKGRSLCRIPIGCLWKAIFSNAPCIIVRNVTAVLSLSLDAFSDDLRCTARPLRGFQLWTRFHMLFEWVWIRALNVDAF